MTTVENVMRSIADMANRGWRQRVLYLNEQDFALMRIHMTERDGKHWFNGVEIRQLSGAPKMPDVDLEGWDNT